jgi:hypothetical protein
MMSLLLNLLNSDEGQDIAEYAVMLGHSGNRGRHDPLNRLQL